MDQSHANGVDVWDPSSFAGEAWDQQFIGQSASADSHSQYPNPEFLDGSNINSQLSGGDHQAGLYRPFEYYGQGDVWPDHAQATAATFAPDPSLQQGYFPAQQHSPEADQTVDGRFGLDMHQQGNEFQAHLRTSANGQIESHHPFGQVVANTSGSTPNGYSQSAIPQWQEQVPAGYVAGQQFEKPLTAAQTSNTSASSFFPGHRADASAFPGYQTEVHQQVPVNPRPLLPQYTAALNRPSQQPVAVAASPRASAQPPVRKATPQQFQQFHPPVPQSAHQRVASSQQQLAQQPVQRPTQSPVQQSPQRPLQPALQPAPQSSASQQGFVQSQAVQHSQPSSENTLVAGVARSTTTGSQVASAATNRAQVLTPVPSSVPPTAPPQPQAMSAPASAPPPAQTQAAAVSAPACSINYKDNALLAEARGRPDAKWKGVPNLVIGPAPVKLQKGTPTKRYVTLTTKGGKDPLFSRAWRAWTPAECLGNHADAYQRASNDLDRQRADLRLEIDMRRGKSEVPADWWRKTLKDRLGAAPPQLGPPAEPDYTSVKAAELVRLHPAHHNNQQLASDACIEFATFLQAKANETKTALTALSDALKKSKVDQAEVDSLTAQAQPAKEQLERAITEGLRTEPGDLFAKLSGSNKVVAIVNNVLIKLVNTSQANSSLTKAILRLYTRLAKFTPEQLEKLQMGKVRKRLEKDGDAEARALMAQVYEKAERKDDDESKSEDSSSGAGSGGRVKKVAPAQTRVLSKKTTQGGDSKKTTSASAAQPASSTSDPAKLPAAQPQSTTMAASNEHPSKAPAKAPQKMPPTATGIKRSREEDTAAPDARSSKKPATDSTPASGAKPTLPVGKTLSAKPVPATATPSSAATQAKPRSGLLLPGKARPATKPAPKTEPTKAEAQRGAAKPESTKPQPAKPTLPVSGSAAAKPAKPKTAEPTQQVAPTKSIFSSLMDEIVEEKTIRTPTTSKKKENGPDPNETPEERERRLRKEARRNLRVAFKSGDAMVEIREFTRHPEEIAEGNMARNVRTDGRYKNSEESEMMKRLHGGQGTKAMEINDREWEEPSAINFDNIPQDKREKTYVTRGGLKAFETEEQKLARERELNELMVIYHNRADIPPSARSPPYEPSLSGSSGMQEAHLPPTVPEYNELVQRGREFREWGPYGASRAAQMRLERNGRPDYTNSYHAHTQRQPEVRPQQPVAKPAPQDPRTWYEPSVAARRDQQTYEILNSDRVRNWQDPDPNNSTYRRMTEEELDNDPKLQAVLASLRKIAEQVQAEYVKRTQAEAKPAPQPAQHEAPKPAAAPVQGAQAAAAPDYSAAWAQYYAAQQQQQQAWYGQQQNAYSQAAANPYMQAQALQAAQQSQTGDQNNQYAGILAALGIQQPSAQPQTQTQPAADQNTAQIQAALMALAANTQAQQAAAPAPAASDPQAQYLLDMMKLAAGQHQNQQYYNQAAAAAQGYGASRPDHDGYGYGQSHPDREASSYAQQMYGGGGERDGGGYGGRERERERERERDRDRDRDHHRGGGGGGGYKGGRGKNNDNVPEHLRGIKSSLIGTKPCAFYAKGLCAKGDKCTFRHD